MAKKRKAKVKLPTDCTGRPIHVNDVLKFGDGTVLRVHVLEWFGDDAWIATDCDEDDFSDNLGSSIIIGRIGKKAKR